MRADELTEDHIGAGFRMDAPPVSGIIGDVEHGGPFAHPGGVLPPPFGDGTGRVPAVFTTHVVLRPLRPGGPPFHIWLVAHSPVEVFP